MTCTTTAIKTSIRNSSLLSLVEVYREKHKNSALQEKTFFERMPSLKLAIYHAAFALDHRTPPKRYSHQRRIRRAPMRQAYKYLSEALLSIENCKTFNELHELLRVAFLRIRGLGQLYTYDTALRIGFTLGIEPSAVYLHAGTRQGARAIGIRSSKIVEVQDLPVALQKLAPHEIENFLCIFKPRAAA